MLFSSFSFLLWFLPLVVLLHGIAPVRAKNAVLLFASVFFYAWGEIRYLPLIGLSLVLNYGLGIAAASTRPLRRHIAVAASLLLNIGALVFFKYTGFLLGMIGLSACAPMISLPLGISFYTFQTQAYVLDVSQRRFPPERRFIDYATFLLLFPQLIAGPIVRYQDVGQALKSRRVTASSLEAGMFSFLVGLSAKVLLANPLGAVWESLRLRPEMSTPAAWLGAVCFGLQIYFDFAGYSRMAIGLGHMLGFAFPANFHHPYAARSVREFWRRWHITLGSWFRTYVYLPLGGSRGGKARTLRNLLIVWSLTGLWHGASWNFLLWGLWFFVFLALEHFILGAWLAQRRVFGLVYTWLVVFAGWMLFAFEDVAQAFRMLQLMFWPVWGTDWVYPFCNHGLLLLLGVLCCVPRVLQCVSRILTAHRTLRVAASLGALLLCIAALVRAGYNPFLYFRF